MKTLLKIVGILLALIVIAGIVLYALAPSEFQVVKSRKFAGVSRDVAYPYISNLQKFDQWNPFRDADPNAKFWYGGVQGSVGDTAFWEGNDSLGVGYQTITSLNSDSVGISLVFTSPWQSKSDVWFTIQGDSTQTEITWGYHAKESFPNNIFMWLIGMEETLGKEYEAGFEKLQPILTAEQANASTLQQ